MTTVRPAPPGPVTRPARVRTLTQRDARTGLALISPTLVIVLAIVVVPLLWSVLLSFQQVRLITVGRHEIFSPLTIENYRRVFTSDVLWSSLATTLIYTAASVTFAVSLGLIAALAVRRPFRGRTLVRASMLLPYVAPVVAVTFVWRIMLNPEFGIINEWGQRFFGWDDPIAFLSQRTGELSIFGLDIPVPVALLTVIAFEGWRYFPFAFLFLLARLSALSADLEEAATVDGATPSQTFRWVILPQLMPVIALLVVLRGIWTFNEFDDIFLLTGGAAGTQVLSIRVYELLTVQQNVGAAAAQSVFMAGVLLMLISVYFRLMRRPGAEGVL